MRTYPTHLLVPIIRTWTQTKRLLSLNGSVQIIVLHQTQKVFSKSVRFKYLNFRSWVLNVYLFWCIAATFTHYYTFLHYFFWFIAIFSGISIFSLNIFAGQWNWLLGLYLNSFAWMYFLFYHLIFIIKHIILTVDLPRFFLFHFLFLDFCQRHSPMIFLIIFFENMNFFYQLSNIIFLFLLKFFILIKCQSKNLIFDGYIRVSFTYGSILCLTTFFFNLFVSSFCDIYESVNKGQFDLLQYSFEV